MALGPRQAFPAGLGGELFRHEPRGGPQPCRLDPGPPPQRPGRRPRRPRCGGADLGQRGLLGRLHGAADLGHPSRDAGSGSGPPRPAARWAPGSATPAAAGKRSPQGPPRRAPGRRSRSRAAPGPAAGRWASTRSAARQATGCKSEWLHAPQMSLVLARAFGPGRWPRFLRYA